MKKFLLCMLVAGLITPAIAQEKTFSFPKSEKIVLHEKEMFDLGTSTQEFFPVNPKTTMIGVDGWSIAGRSDSYDRQTQHAVYPMTKRHDDGFIGCTWTTDDNPDFTGGNLSKRGIGYSYSTDNAITWSEQDNRAGDIPLYWPSYAQWGAHGEAILGRSAESYDWGGVQILNGLVLLTREQKGQGEWTITPVPYPAGTSPDADYFMAYARMATSGKNHQYIHIMSPMILPEEQTHEGYYNPVFYYRTQTGGATWDIEGALVPQMLGEQWNVNSQYDDAITFADTKGDMVACAFINLANDGYVLKSFDNGDTWECIKFFETPVNYYTSPDEYADSCYIPVQGCIALDNDGKIHVAFSVLEAMNNEEEGYITYFVGITSSFLTYWNENMDPLHGDTDFVYSQIHPILMDYFDWELSNEHQLYVKSTIPQMPIIGYFIGEPYFMMEQGGYPWYKECYGIGNTFSFPQMIFDNDNILHLTYLGLLEGDNDGYNRHHPFYTTRDTDLRWSKTEHLVNKIDIVDREFAYLTSAGFGNDQWHLMVQVDGQVGTYIGDCQSTPTDNYFYFFSVKKDYPPAINDIEKTSLSMSVIPNPASGQATVRFEGQGAITVYNILGQTVYHVENVEDEKVISLNNMATGVYFVTVRSGNATATQKLIVK